MILFLRCRSRIIGLFFLVFVSACSSVPKDDLSKGVYKVGNPYSVQGIKYYPKVEYDYDEMGIASWYGPGFDGKRTANGERFYQNELTAAHKTLPMPSIVRVTNLENGKSVIVRINDRGPFSRGRLIDVSSKAADLLGFKGRGTAKVRVQVLEQESKNIAQAAMNGESTRGYEVALNKSGSGDSAVVQKASLVSKPDNVPMKTVLSTKRYGDVPGHIKNGNFYPDPVLSAMSVKPTQIYVQVGSFTAKENADKLLINIPGAFVKEVNINGKHYYRVRVQARTVDDADKILRTVIKNGHKNAMITVE